MILDASALLAFLHDEPGAQHVASVLRGSSISTVNWAEVVQQALKSGVNVDGLSKELEEWGLEFIAFSPEQAEIASQLMETTRRYGLSLGDRACLALAFDRHLSVMTADRIWGLLDLQIDIYLIR